MKHTSMTVLLRKQIEKLIINIYCLEHNVCSWVPLMYLWSVLIELLDHFIEVRPLEGNARVKKQGQMSLKCRYIIVMMLQRRTTRVGKEGGDCEHLVMNIPLQDAALLTISASTDHNCTTASPHRQRKKLNICKNYIQTTCQMYTYAINWLSFAVRILMYLVVRQLRGDLNQLKNMEFM